MNIGFVGITRRHYALSRWPLSKNLRIMIDQKHDEHIKIGQNDNYAHNENKRNLALGHI